MTCFGGPSVTWAAGPVPRGPAWRPSRTQGAPALDRSPRSPAWARPTAARTSLRCRTVARRQKRLLDFYPVTLVVGWSYALCTAWSAAYCVLDRSLLRLPQNRILSAQYVETA